jgi:hypothetical protein
MSSEKPFDWSSGSEHPDHLSRYEKSGTGRYGWVGPFQIGERSSVSIRKAGYMGALPTQGVMAHHGKEKTRKNLWMMARTWTNWNLTRELLGTINLKERM